MLAGRGSERAALTDLLVAARAGRAGVLQLVGDAGIGKTTLVADLLTRADGFRVLHSVGVRGESHIPYAGLLALLRPLQEHLPGLSPAQGRAVAIALGLESGEASGELVIGAACLQLVAMAADRAPVLLVADDVQWFDEESWRALSFAARRVGGERVAVVLSARAGSGRQVEGVPTLLLSGLDDVAAGVLLNGVHPDVTVDVCHQLLILTGGNPLALAEAARGLTAQQRAGAAALPERLPTSDDLTVYFSSRADTCPEDTQELLLLAALDGRGDLAVLAAAAVRLGLDLSAIGAAEDEGLVTLDHERLTFRHPLVAAAVLERASPQAGRAAHAVLAAVLTADPDRAAWHAASACVAADATVADALTDVGVRARSGAAPEAASSAFEREAALTPDPVVRVERLLWAAEAALVAGVTARACALAADVDPDRLPAPDRGRAALVRGRAAMLLGRPEEAAPLLLEAACGLDLRSAAAALAEAVDAALETGDLDFARLLISRVDQVWPESDDPVLALHLARARHALQGSTGDAVDSARALRGRIEALTDPRDIGDSATVWLALAAASCSLSDISGGVRRFRTAAAHARGSGDLPLLGQALAGQAFAEHVLGRWTSAYATGTRALELMDEDRSPYPLADVLQVLAEIDAARGHEDLCRRRCAQVRGIAERLGLRQLGLLAERREALLYLGLNRFEMATVRLQRIRREQEELGLRHPYLSALPDLVEVYVRAGDLEGARDLVSEFAALVVPGAPPHAYGRLLRIRALVAARDQYAELFEESVSIDAATGADFLRARTLLCYGERLRRDRHRVEARTKLRDALEVFDGLDALPWTQRARVELAATGETVHRGPLAASEQLTPQELQIAVLVAEGQRNKEIAATMFLSVRTVEFHLTRVYRKLSVVTRAELASRFRAPAGAP